MSIIKVFLNLIVDSAAGQKALQEDLSAHLSSLELLELLKHRTLTVQEKKRTLNPFCKFYLIEIDSNKVAILDYNLTII